MIISPRAIQDLREIVRYISLDDPKTARRFGEKLVSAAESLAILPERGRIVPEFDDAITREIVVYPYRIVYRYDKDDNTVGIARFWHGARLLDETAFRF
ncbi:MAG: type II toxin-antitoxin system RelE/ParE family toxin [Prosthecobacter sp.]|nr:type II toxin-antitoxin system RelE/ParE family toxin [Prosthecobacter sp.]